MRITKPRSTSRTKRVTRTVRVERPQFTTTALCLVTIAALLIFNTPITFSVARAEETTDITTDTNHRPEDNEDKKIDVCHFPQGNMSNPQIINISENAWPAHQSHEGDFIIESESDAARCVATPPPATDLCPNIDGIQEQVPAGKIVVEGQCVEQNTENHTPTLVFTLTPPGDLDQPQTDQYGHDVFWVDLGATEDLGWLSTYTNECHVPTPPPYYDWTNDAINTLTSGSFNFVADSTHTFALTCDGDYGSITKVIRVITRKTGSEDVCPNIEGVQTTVPEEMYVNNDTMCVYYPPTLDLTFNPAGTLDQGQSDASGHDVFWHIYNDAEQLIWTTTHATECHLPTPPPYYDWTDSAVNGATQGAFPFTANENHTFALTCTGPGGSVTKVTRSIVEQPPVTDLCPNIEGTQTEVPEGLIVNDEHQCVLPPQQTDYCPNIEGTQSEVPENMHVNTDGMCVANDTPPTDLCPNLEGNQSTIPQNMHLNNDGMCVLTEQTQETPAIVTYGGTGSGNRIFNFGGNSGNGGSVLGAFDSNGSVLGASSSCSLYIAENLKYGENNNPNEVIKLQAFLNEYLGADLPLNGIFGLGTLNAVKKFQLQFKDEILSPWIKIGWIKTEHEATGWVYKTTRRKINNLICPELQLPQPELN